MLKQYFNGAKPVWLSGMELDKNITMGLRASFRGDGQSSAILMITASASYRVFLNDELIRFGPAKGPHGYFRVDEWELTISEQNILAIEVVGYNVNSFCTLDQSSFIQAEIRLEERVLFATGQKDMEFEACLCSQRIQKVQRYSFQRAFIEAYRFQGGMDRWWNSKNLSNAAINSNLKEVKLISRGVSYPDLHKQKPVKHHAYGTFHHRKFQGRYHRDRAMMIGPKLGGFKVEELKLILSDQLLDTAVTSMNYSGVPYLDTEILYIKEKEFAILDFGVNLTGFIGLKVSCQTPSRLVLTFDEILSSGDIDFLRLTCVNAVSIELQAGDYIFEAFEPYTMKYLKLMAFKGSMAVSGVYLRDCANPDVYKARFKCPDEELNRIFEAGRETFRQNAFDIYMDCPSRERAGWLCDSFFTARVEPELTGGTLVERNFLENYSLPDTFEYLPEGMLPMCYPADHNDGVFIPNWAMWFIIELEEYLERSGDRELVMALKPKVIKLFDYFQRFKNEDGLLENLEGWVFIEWSRANDFINGINYQSNMLFAASLGAAGRLYGYDPMVKEADRLRDVIRKQSFNGDFFVDNAVRNKKKLELTGNISEVCQYYAFFTGTADEEEHRKLLKILLEEFGPHREKDKVYPYVFEANAFIGNYLRLELLSRNGCIKQMLTEMKELFMYMIKKTGTLWEHNGDFASCNHGFASHAVHSLYRDVLGVERIDTVRRKVFLRFTDAGLACCEGEIPVKDGAVMLKWKVEAEVIRYHLEVPEGYDVVVRNIADKELICM